MHLLKSREAGWPASWKREDPHIHSPKHRKTGRENRERVLREMEEAHSLIPPRCGTAVGA